jgi:hypothetical protein
MRPIQAVQEAIDGVYNLESQANDFATYNERGCPLDMHGNWINGD